MAIFYKHIKGCGSNVTNSSGFWSWIEWQNSTTLTPKIYTSVDNDFDSASSLGYIITSDAQNQYISQTMKFSAGIKTNQILPSNQAQGQAVTKISIDNNNIEFYTSDIYRLKVTNKYVSIHSPINAYFDANFTKNLYVGTAEDTNNGIIKAYNKCEALYFNATSDRRAKSNITPLSASALSIVKSLPIYTFNYTSKPEETTIGLIAQEAAEHDLDNFNMVDNFDASGENNDFMQMKESKLVYVLWKAVQELSEEVESLKAQLNNK